MNTKQLLLELIAKYEPMTVDEIKLKLGTNIMNAISSCVRERQITEQNGIIITIFGRETLKLYQNKVKNPPRHEWKQNERRCSKCGLNRSKGQKYYWHDDESIRSELIQDCK